jgi:hypothetical protein
VIDNYDQDLGMPDDQADTAPIESDQMEQNSSNQPLDPDFGRITLHLLPSDVNTGTVELTLSDSSAVRLFNANGAEVNDLTLD